MSCVDVKCVICGHKWQAALINEMPMCRKCYGPVTVVRAMTHPEPNRRPKTKVRPVA